MGRDEPVAPSAERTHRAAAGVLIYLRWAAYLLVWIACLVAVGVRYHQARTEYDDTKSTPAEWRRPGGNHGHTHIDFGGQWLMGRMVARGFATDLYNRNRLWQVARAGFPIGRESEAARERSFPAAWAPHDHEGYPARHDADALLDWIIADDSPRWSEVGVAVALPLAGEMNPLAAATLSVIASSYATPELADAVTAKVVGGPLYPPIHGFFYAPLCFDDDPAAAYARFQTLLIGLTFVAGFGLSAISRGRIWWPTATLILFVYPGYRSGLVLGQNPVITLAILSCGWALAVRGRDVPGGVVWGLLAFKPVWAAAFFLVPLLMGRWRFCLAMILTGASLAAATLPFTGLQPWLDWLEVGKKAAAQYDVNENWVRLSRDLHGIPKRILVDFQKPEAERHHPTARAIGWALWTVVVGTTVGLYLLFADRRQPTGLAAGFMFLGAFLSCYRFMYYDVLLSLLAVAVLWAEPGPLFRAVTWHLKALPAGPRWAGYLLAPPVLWWLILLGCEHVLTWYEPLATLEVIGMATKTTDAAGVSVKHIPKLSAGIGYFYPWETLLVLALWAWCGWRLVWGLPVRDASQKRF